MVANARAVAEAAAAAPRKDEFAECRIAQLIAKIGAYAGRAERVISQARRRVLARGRGMKRCRLHGRQRFELLVGAAVLANNLLIIAARLQAKGARRLAA